MFGRKHLFYRSFAAVLCIWLLALVSPAEARRLALVVGNAEYQNVPALRNAVNDARAMADALKRLGFEVTLLTDVGSDEFWLKLDAFSKEAETAESTMLFYSGHAFQLSGVNYLVPVGAKLTSRESIKTETWSLDGIIARLQNRKRQTLIFLDACRNDPLPAGLRGSGASADGLARLQTGVGTFVAFATEPGAVTFDGAGEADHSPFTTALLDNIEKPGLSVSDMMIKVRNQVEENTFRRQTPWDQSSLRSQFYFVPAEETKQELSAADFELLAQLAPDDRRKFLELLRASGFSDRSLKEAEAAIEVASLDLEIAAEGAVTLGEVGDPGPDQVASDATAAEPDPNAFLDDLVIAEGGGTQIGDAPTPGTTDVASIDTGAAPTPPVNQPVNQPVGQPVGQSASGGDQVAGQPTEGQPTEGQPIEGQPIEGLPVDPAARPDGEAPPVRLAALSWETRGILGINALTVDRLRVAGKRVTPDSDENRKLLAAIDPSLVEEEKPAELPADLAMAAQTELKRLGCYQMRVDGDWGKGSKTALTSYFLAKRSVPDTLDPTAALVEQLMREDKVVCEVRVATVAPRTPKAEETVAVKTAKKKAKAVETKKKITKSLIGVGSF